MPYVSINFIKNQYTSITMIYNGAMTVHFATPAEIDQWDELVSKNPNGGDFFQLAWHTPFLFLLLYCSIEVMLPQVRLPYKSM